MFRGKMSSKGQVVIPKEVREAVNLQPDSNLLFEVTAPDRITIHIMKPISSLRGFLKGKVKKVLTDEELEEAIAQAVADSYQEEEESGRYDYP